jgi:periplasmic divalent cation tolerance protein
MAYVTAPDRTTARQIARTILEARLAACANLLPAESFYRWEGRIEHADEIVVVFKTRPALVRRLLAAVSDAHPYDVPCAVAYEAVGALPAYAAWIEASTSGQA